MHVACVPHPARLTSNVLLLMCDAGHSLCMAVRRVHWQSLTLRTLALLRYIDRLVGPMRRRRSGWSNASERLDG